MRTPLCFALTLTTASLHYAYAAAIASANLIGVESPDGQSGGIKLTPDDSFNTIQTATDVVTSRTDPPTSLTPNSSTAKKTFQLATTTTPVPFTTQRTTTETLTTVKITTPAMKLATVPLAIVSSEGPIWSGGHFQLTGTESYPNFIHPTYMPHTVWQHQHQHQNQHQHQHQNQNQHQHQTQPVNQYGNIPIELLILMMMSQEV